MSLLFLFLRDAGVWLILLLSQLLPVAIAALAGWWIAPKVRLGRATGACLAALLVIFVRRGSTPSVEDSSLLWVLGVAMLSPWFLAPVLLYRRPQALGGVAPEPFDPVRHPTSDAAVARMRQSVAALEAEGFALVDDAAMRVSADGPATRWILMDHASEAVRALLIGGKDARTHSLHLVSLLADGRWLGMTNDVDPSPYPAPRDVVALPCPDLREPEELMAAFRTFARQAGGSEPRSLPPGIDVETHTAVTLRRSEEAMLAAGWLRRVGERYRFSLRGAFLTLWRQFTPIYQLRLAKRRRRQDRGLRGLGIARPPRTREASARWLSLRTVPLAMAAVFVVFLLPWPGPADRGAGEEAAATLIPERLPAGFTVPGDFPGAVAALERLAGARAQPLMVDSGFSRVPSPDVMQVHVAKARGQALLAAAQPVFLARGFVLFRTQLFQDVHGEPESLALFAGRDPLDAVAKMSTNGANYGIDPPRVAAWLREVQRDYPLTLSAAGFDYVEARFQRPLSAAEARALALRVARFCPDVVEQGTGTTAALAREMHATQTLFCWWD